MADSILLKIVRDSILEVYQTKWIIDKEALLQTYPILSTPLNCSITIYIQEEPKNTYSTKNDKTLLENIIIAAKKAAFEDPLHPPLSSSKYLSCEIELTLHTAEGDISEKDSPIINDEATLLV